MNSKYSTRARYRLARVKRDAARIGLRTLVDWTDLRRAQLKPGCTAIIGACHRLPFVLPANLRYLTAHAWPDLEKIIIVFDGTEGCVDKDFLSRAKSSVGDVDIDILYYSPAQARVADLLQFPFVYAWLSWSIGIAHARTSSILLHDYDALVLSERLQERYEAFLQDQSKVQGIRWYSGSGIVPGDRLATTFEAFIDLDWLRGNQPIDFFNKVDRIGERMVDYDILLYLQDVTLAADERSVMAMDNTDLLHPSQMIHQYTMARRHPDMRQPCSSLLMIPIFEYLSGKHQAIQEASRRLKARNGKRVAFFDDVPVNFADLRKDQVDWVLKQVLYAQDAVGLDLSNELFEYGNELYRLADIQPECFWRDDFTLDQRKWVDQQVSA